MAQGLKSNIFKQLESISLKKNYFKTDTINELISSLPLETLELNLSYNDIDLLGV